MNDGPQTDPKQATLPDSQGQSFSTLDAYLAHLKTQGVRDIPYYELKADGRYELITRRPPTEAAQYFTRCELAAKFGFSC